jgi:hypothetical protein
VVLLIRTPTVNGISIDALAGWQANGFSDKGWFSESSPRQPSWISGGTSGFINDAPPSA